jgi:glutaconate CoA-transferase, subunit B
MPESAEDFSIDELMAVVLARELKNGQMGMGTMITYLADAAVCLAKLTHAKELIYYAHNGWDPKEYTISALRNVEHVTKSAVFVPDWQEILSLGLRGKIDFQIVAPAQIDKYGNVNNNLIGDLNQPEVRLPGSLGLPEISCYQKRMLIYEPKHVPRVFVEEVDFVAGLRKGTISGGSSIVVSNLAVMDFEENSGLMRLKSLHPGATLEDIRWNTGFDMIIPESLPETEKPTAEQVNLLRTKIDPLGLRKHRM